MANYTPLPCQEWKPVQFITAVYPNGEGIETDGEFGYHLCRNLFAVVEHLVKLRNAGAIIYSMFEGRKLAEATRGDCWKVFDWNGRTSYYVFCSVVKIYPFSSISQDLDSVWPFFEWLKSLDITPGGMTGIAQKLWRRSLKSKVQLYDGSKNGRLALYGGRKEAIKGQYHHVRYHDMTSAFPTTMSEMMVPRTIIEDKPKWYEAGFAFATVRVPKDLAWKPLPMRFGKMRNIPIISYGYGIHTDFWSFADLRIARNAGSDVIIHRAFRGFDSRLIFENWFISLIFPARASLSGDAQRAVKTVANRLWSSFAVGGSARKSEYTDGLRRRVLEKHTNLRGMFYESYVAAEIQAQVRVRLYDGLMHLSEPSYIDTDGVISYSNEPVADGWAIKHRMRYLEIHGPQSYMWECYRCGIFNCDGPHFCTPGNEKTFREKKIGVKAGAERQEINPIWGINLASDDAEYLRERYGASYPNPEIDFGYGNKRQTSLFPAGRFEKRTPSTMDSVR